MDDLDSMNATIDRMRSFTPTDPYILTIPQDDPKYRHDYAFQQRAYTDKTPFDSSDPEYAQIYPNLSGDC
jgi:hypothetical protein